MNDDKYDPERELWIPGRRSFLFLGGMAALATAIGVKPDPRLDWIAFERLTYVHVPSPGFGYYVFKDKLALAG